MDLYVLLVLFFIYILLVNFQCFESFEKFVTFTPPKLEETTLDIPMYSNLASKTDDHIHDDIFVNDPPIAKPPVDIFTNNEGDVNISRSFIVPRMTKRPLMNSESAKQNQNQAHS